jgi:CRP/FNR family transcriptional regulator
MLSASQLERLVSQLGWLKNASEDLRRELQDNAFFARIPTGREIFALGDSVDSIALLLSGVVRVYKIGETGREITLYRFGTGESCILSANAILNQQAFSAIALVEENAEAVMIPSDVLRDWVKRYDLWRDFIFNLLSQRLNALMEIVDEVAFQRMDIRLANLLLKLCQKDNPILITHQELAAELGSSREVISRLLENFARQGLIRLGRGSIEVPDSQVLAELALR